MRRREVITLLGGVATWPLAAQAQQLGIPVIGILSASGQPNSDQLGGFLKGLEELGYYKGRNIGIEIRATSVYGQLPALAAELVHDQVTVIYALGAVDSAKAAKAATATIPIVFINGSDPITLGLVTSMNRPGGNVTGVSLQSGELVPKRLELLRELVPKVSRIAFLVNPTNARHSRDETDVQVAAHDFGQDIMVLNASTPAEIDAAFATGADRGTGAFLINADAFFVGRFNQIAALEARYRIPTSYSNRAGAQAGGLLSYGDDRQDSYRQAGIYVGRILKGAKPAELPVLQPTKFELVINRKTAKLLGIDIPPRVLAIADEVID
jgi:putative ABC transport system substrate-binding protein